MPHRTILLHPLAPPKPALDAPCNGCGVCCALEPCPLGMWISRRRTGACVALQWQGDAVGGDSDGPGRYRCGVVAEPARWLPALPAAWARRLALRWIAAARGCDCSEELA